MTSATTDVLPDQLVERVLTGLGFSRTPDVTLDGLSALFAAWSRGVPFDNVRKLIHIHRQDPGPFPGDDSVDFFESWLQHGTGGTCEALRMGPVRDDFSKVLSQSELDR